VDVYPRLHCISCCIPAFWRVPFSGPYSIHSLLTSHRCVPLHIFAIQCETLYGFLLSINHGSVPITHVKLFSDFYFPSITRAYLSQLPCYSFKLFSHSFYCALVLFRPVPAHQSPAWGFYQFPFVCMYTTFTLPSSWSQLRVPSD
jgi:hypothetical protein